MGARTLSSIVTTIQSAIQKVSAMAMELRPPSLDELGVMATLEWYFREFQHRHPEIRVQSEVEIKEDEVSRSLKIIIYRIIQETLENLAKFSLTNQVSIQLKSMGSNIVLAIEDNGRMYSSGDTVANKSEEKRIWLFAIEERAVMSGGTVSSVSGNSGGWRIQITWPG